MRNCRLFVNLRRRGMCNSICWLDVWSQCQIVKSPPLLHRRYHPRVARPLKLVVSRGVLADEVCLIKSLCGLALAVASCHKIWAVLKTVTAAATLYLQVQTRTLQRQLYFWGCEKNLPRPNNNNDNNEMLIKREPLVYTKVRRAVQRKEKKKKTRTVQQQ